MCPDVNLCRSCYYSNAEDHSLCYILGGDVLAKERKRKELLNAGEYILSSAINVGRGVVHAIFASKGIDVGRYMPLEYYQSLPKNEVLTLSEIDSQIKMKPAPSDYYIELE